jgi:hypothetical protein
VYCGPGDLLCFFCARIRYELVSCGVGITVSASSSSVRSTVLLCCGTVCVGEANGSGVWLPLEFFLFVWLFLFIVLAISFVRCS